MLVQADSNARVGHLFLRAQAVAAEPSVSFSLQGQTSEREYGEDVIRTGVHSMTLRQGVVQSGIIFSMFEDLKATLYP